MKDYLEPLILLVLILCLFISWLFYAKARHAERLLMIEKGIDANEVLKNSNGFKFPWLKLGFLILGLSLGLGVALLLIGKKKFGQTIPFGPFLATAGIVILFWGDKILDWYLNLRLS